MILKIAGWFAIAVAVVSLLVFATIRINLLDNDPGTASAFDVRYIQHPVLTLAHLLPGILFLTLAPLQFIPALRRRYLPAHRLLGRVLVGCGLLSGVFGLIAGFDLPAFGGITTVSATLFFGVIFLFALGRALWHIRHKRVALHREWMIRTFSLAAGVATIRIFIGVFQVAGYSMLEIFGASFWLGFGINLVIAELWINHTRVAGKSAAPTAIPVNSATAQESS